jgi:predicted AlkP superfamily pyrophosphatase or phosphodiesterase
MMSRLAALALLGLFAFAALTAAGPPPPPPKLVVLIVVDQLRYDYLTRFENLFQGGFRRLLDEGAVFTNARFRQGMTLTSPGHATISTGRHPSQHGVTANYRYDPAAGKRVGAVFDPAEKAVGGAGSTSSPRILETPTLADLLKAQTVGSRTVGVSLKDRSAILLVGKKADGAYWVSADCGCVVTSSYYHHRAPHWLEAFNARKLADSYYGEVWKPFLEDRSLYEKYARADHFPSESNGREPSFPHRIEGSPPDPGFYESVMNSALSDEIVLNAALAAIEGHRLGDDGIPDLLAISFAGVDRVGHVFGPFSQEAMDQILRLDYVLGRLLDELDEQVGLDQTVIALTADHGVIPMVEHLQREGKSAARFPKPLIPDAVNRAINEKHPGSGNVVAYFDPPHIFFDLARLDGLGISRSEAEDLGSQAILATGYVEKVYRHADFLNKRESDDPFFALYRNSFYAPRSQHLIVQLKENHYIDRSQGSTGHGSPYDYDRHVPVIFLGKQISSARHARPAAPEDIAPTLAKILGIQMEPDSDSRLLDEVLR